MLELVAYWLFGLFAAALALAIGLFVAGFVAYWAWQAAGAGWLIAKHIAGDRS